MSPSIIAAAALGSLVGTAMMIAAAWLRDRLQGVEPLKGEQYLLDGRLVTVEDPRDYHVWIYTATGQHQGVSRDYWRRRARPAASDPPQLRDVTRAAGGDR